MEDNKKQSFNPPTNLPSSNNNEASLPNPYSNTPALPASPIPNKEDVNSNKSDSPNPLNPFADEEKKENKKLSESSDKSYTFKSSIRTMEGDMEAISSGKKVSGLALSKKAEGKFDIKEEKPLAPEPKKEVGPEVSLGESNKSKFIPTPPKPKSESEPEKEAKSEVSLGESNKSKLMVPPPKLKDIAKKPEPPKKNITIPKKKKSSKILWYVILIAVIIGGGAYWYLIIRPDSNNIATVTPTLTPIATLEPSATPTPLIKDSIVLGSDGNQTSSLLTSIDNESVGFRELKMFSLKDNNGVELTFQNFKDRFLINPPVNITQGLGNNVVKIILFGQSESFDDTTNMAYGFVIKIDPVISIDIGLSSWEMAMANDFGELFGLDLKSVQSGTFSDNIYVSTNIRYRNFPFPDSTIDYAIIENINSNGNIEKYLIIVNSREMIYETIDNFSDLIVDY